MPPSPTCPSLHTHHQLVSLHPTLVLHLLLDQVSRACSHHLSLSRMTPTLLQLQSFHLARLVLVGRAIARSIHLENMTFSIFPMSSITSANSMRTCLTPSTPVWPDSSPLIAHCR